MVEREVDNTSNTDDKDTPVARPEGQFMKSLSLESGNSLEVFTMMKEPPEVDVTCNVNTSSLENDQYLVTIDIKTEAIMKNNSDKKKRSAFKCSTEYCGLFTIKNLSDEQKEHALLIEAPTLLFPFARRIISTATTDAGFPPLMLAPINFSSKYMESKSNSKTVKV